jgi:c-di-GMP-binding flagellar brake protein YcgR
MKDELKSGQNGNEPGDNEKPDNLLALNLGIGDAIQIQDASASNRTPNRRYYVKLIGFLNKASFVVTHPAQAEKLLVIEDGQSFLVRGFSGRTSYEFNAKMLFAAHSPYPHLHLSFPSRIECLTMRGALRVQPKLAGWIEPMDTASDWIKIPAIVVDLSTSGARVHANKKIGHIGDQVKFAFDLPIDGEEQAFLISAVIRKSYEDTVEKTLGGGHIMTHGLEFIQPEGHVRMALQNYIYKTMAEG